jgi:O-methyltransferase involved in polyketide biosynthesis
MAMAKMITDADGRTKLTAVLKDGQWTVRIVWPNGTNHYFGKFRTEIEAATWVTDHRWMTAQVIKDRDLLRRGGRPKAASETSLA